jgi:hypothetical protein
VWVHGGFISGSAFETFGAFIMKWLFLPIAVALSACATVSPPREHGTGGVSEQRATLGTQTITRDQLNQTGRTDLSEALRMFSPIFH